MSSPTYLQDHLHPATNLITTYRPLALLYTHLILSALFPIYTGAHASLSRPSSAAKPAKKDKKAQDGDEEDEDEDEDKIQKMEGLSNKDAIILPVTAGVVLAGLYYLITTYGADVINLIMGWYFSFVGVYSVSQLVRDAFKVAVGFVSPEHFAYEDGLWRASNDGQMAVRQDGGQESTDLPLPPVLRSLPMPRSLKMAMWSTCRAGKQRYTLRAYIKSLIDIKSTVTPIGILSAFIGLGTIIYVNTVDKPWFLTNLQGFAVSYSALQLMSPTSFATGSLILGALFCYDIWAVFFTPLMVTVAKNLDQPIKLVFPRPDEPSSTPGEPPVRSYSMLGLGDIVLPGIMIGLALRFDLYLFYLRKQNRIHKAVTGSDGVKTTVEHVEKVPFVSPNGKWGDRFWTRRLPATQLPTKLRASFPKRYFKAAMVGYVIGMLTTLGVMTLYAHAQPALLYLVPAVLISLWGTALIRGELKEMWYFSEAVTGEQLDEEEQSDNKQDPEKSSRDGQAAKGLFERLWQELWLSPPAEAQKSGEATATQEEVEESSQEPEIGQTTPAAKADQPRDGMVFAFYLILNGMKDDGAREGNSKPDKSDANQSPEQESSNSAGTATSNSNSMQDFGDGTSGPKYRTRSTAEG